MIRSYHEGDAPLLAPIHTAVFPDDPLPTTAFRSYISSMLAYGAQAWVLVEDLPIGYALAIPVPGLPHIADLKGCMTPARQRQGLGSLLLQRVIADLKGTSIKQITCQVRDLESSAARFLHKHNFFIEHEEWLMRREDLKHLPLPEHRDRPAIVTLPRREAVAQFQRIFSASFAGYPWNQPYSEDEIESALVNAADILFLTLGSNLIGFAWLHLEAGGTGVIEPVGLLPAHQGKGYGRFLLLSALHELAHRGASQAQIGAWRTNETAIHLYHSLGFEHKETITYLAYDLASRNHLAA